MIIYLTGNLGDEFGKVYDLDVRSPAEAVQALSLQLPGFLEKLNRDDEFYIVKTAGVDQGISQGDLTLPARQFIEISPVIVGGGGNGFLSILTGVALIAGSFLLPGVSLLGVNLSAAAGLIGASLVLNGISQLISPVPQKPKEGDKAESQIIDPYGQIAAQGSRVPVVYGEMKLDNLIPISQFVTAYGMITLSDAAAQYTRVTTVEIPYDPSAVADYSYVFSPRTLRYFDTSFLTNNDPFTGMVVNGSSFKVRVTFSVSPQGLNIRTAYAVQRVRVFSAVHGYPGAQYMRIYRSDGVDLVGSAIGLVNGGWWESDLSVIPAFNTKYSELIFEFFGFPGESYVAIGELQIFGAVGLNENVLDVRPPA